VTTKLILRKLESKTDVTYETSFKQSADASRATAGNAAHRKHFFVFFPAQLKTCWPP